MALLTGFEDARFLQKVLKNREETLRLLVSLEVENETLEFGAADLNEIGGF